VFFGMAPLGIAVLNEPSLATKNPEDRIFQHLTAQDVTGACRRSNQDRKVRASTVQ
jgi:hypothetical protein